MSTKKLTMKSQIGTRMSDEIAVLSAKQIGDDIYPSNVRPSESVHIKNAKYVTFEDSTGSITAYIVRDGADSLYIANLKNSELLGIVVTMASGNQRAVVFQENGSSNDLEMFHDYEFIIRTANDNIRLEPADNLFLLPVNDIFVTTYERHI